MRNIILIFFSILLFSCNAQKKNISNTLDAGDGELTLLIKDNYSNIDTPEIQIIKEAKSLKSFFSTINKSRKPGLAVPRVDFNKSMLIALCSGEQEEGKVIALTLDKEEDLKLILKVTEDKVVNKNASSTTISTPFYLYKMPLTDKEIVFVKEDYQY